MNGNDVGRHLLINYKCWYGNGNLEPISAYFCGTECLDTGSSEMASSSVW